jgi:anti-sigma regulatory factor (Ser/Thr protein kinase)
VSDVSGASVTAESPITTGPVLLEVPPLSGMSRVARLTAIGVASMAGFTMDEIDDINVMVSEVMVALVEHGARSTISVSFDVTDACFTVRGETDIVDFDLNHPDLALCRTVLAAVSTSHGIEGTSARAAIWANLQSPRR